MLEAASALQASMTCSAGPSNKANNMARGRLAKAIDTSAFRVDLSSGSIKLLTSGMPVAVHLPCPIHVCEATKAFREGRCQTADSATQGEVLNCARNDESPVLTVFPEEMETLRSWFNATDVGGTASGHEERYVGHAGAHPAVLKGSATFDPFLCVTRSATASLECVCVLNQVGVSYESNSIHFDRLAGPGEGGAAQELQTRTASSNVHLDNAMLSSTSMAAVHDATLSPSEDSEGGVMRWSG